MPEQPMPDYYALLGVTRNASTDEIRRAYRQQARAVHPDAGGNAAIFQLITIAHETLSDPGLREQYDNGSAAAEDPQPTAADHSAGASARPNHAQARTSGHSSDPVDDAAPSIPLAIDTSASEVLVPRPRRWRTEVAAALFLLAIAAGVWISAGATHPALGSTVVLAGLTIALLLAAVWLPNRVHPMDSRLYGFAGMAGVALGAYRGYTTEVWAAVVGPVAAAIIVGACAALDRFRWTGSRVLDRLVPKQSASATIFGRPGAGDDASIASTIHDHALLVHRLIDMPGVRVFHAVRPPAGGPPIAHVVVRGSKIAFIDSVRGPDGAYALSPFADSLMANGAHLPGGEVSGPSAVAAWPYSTDATSAFARPKSTQARAFVMVATPAGRVASDDVDAVIGGPMTVLGECAKWLADAARDGTVVVDRRLIYDVYRNIVQ
ncbi:DnaJ domain-containing protein [Rhodococcus hoagii]|nr:DnaJ domain-containing protein [Prescottella equi]NKS71703.1 DnaJ domain-containing protein [Prescottella equi]